MSNHVENLTKKMEAQTIIGALLDESRKSESAGHLHTALALCHQAELFIPFVSGEYRADYRRYVATQKADVEYGIELLPA